MLRQESKGENLAQISLSPSPSLLFLNYEDIISKYIKKIFK